MNKGLQLLIFSLLFSISPFQSQSQSDEIMTDSKFELTQTDIYQRYILVKGKKLIDEKAKLQEWAELFTDDEPVNLTIKRSELGSWTLLKLPNDDLLTAYNYHNLVYWFLGTPPEDNNYADYTIGISIDKKNQSTYLIYNDYDLREKIATEDDVFGISEKNQKFILSIPFDELKPTQSNNISDFRAFLSANDIDLNELRSQSLSWTEFQIKVK